MEPSNTPGKPEYWRSLAEYEDTPEFREALEAEFPGTLERWTDPTTRRAFLRRMGASLSLAGISGAGLSGCGEQPQEEIVPQVDTPEQKSAGETQVFATSMPAPGGAMGLLATSRDGRPLKIEGNPLHPASLGATDIFAQASILDLYDPDRSEVVRHRGQISNWADFSADLTLHLAEHQQREGGGLHLLTCNLTSPTLLRQIQELLERYPEARWYEDDVHDARNVNETTSNMFGKPLSPKYSISDADVIFSVDMDFLGTGPRHVRLAREFARRRNVPASGKGNFNRLYVAECTPSLTGASADHRLAVPMEKCGALLGTIANRLGLAVEEAGDPGVPADWISALVDDLKRAGERALVVVGESQPAELHALCYAINSHLGSLGRTIQFIPPVDRLQTQPASIAELSEAIDDNQVETLLILDANPVFTAPGDLNLAEKLGDLPFTAHLGQYRDETADVCEWHLPMTHYLESWSDARGPDGTAGIIQPLISPLYNGVSSHQILNLLLGQPDRSDYDTVRQTWQEELGDQDFDRRWKRAVHDGVIPDSEFPAAEVELAEDFKPVLPAGKTTSPQPGDVEILFRPDPALLDGRYANNGWLQELPKPFTKLTWTNAALVSPEFANENSLNDGDAIELSANGSHISIPIIRMPGQPKHTVTLHLGHGRRKAGRNGDGVGVDVNPLRTLQARWETAGTWSRTERHVELPRTQNHFLMEGRDLVRQGTWQEFQQNPQDPSFAKSGEHHGSEDSHEGEHHPPPTLYPERESDPPQWGMTINLGSCIGCNACTIACQAENNIPVVGPEEVRRGREMHWIRVDTYYSGKVDNPQVQHQPVPCMHCEHAPCEPVCPVAATTHSEEGLNEMTYNRCIGTRYCSNNCPYKVRRFNFLDYRQDLKQSPVLQLLQNPQVSVRSRGVMEKCTYCIQRISAARIHASMQEREIEDGEVVTACQAVCPTEAIVFGDQSDPDSQVSQAKSHPLNYGLLEELNTRPRTTYLASVTNPSPQLATGGHE